VCHDEKMYQKFAKIFLKSVLADQSCRAENLILRDRSALALRDFLIDLGLSMELVDALMEDPDLNADSRSRANAKWMVVSAVGDYFAKMFNMLLDLRTESLERSEMFKKGIDWKDTLMELMEFRDDDEWQYEPEEPKVRSKSLW